MEIIEDKKTEEVDKFHLRWKMCEFYPYVMKIVQDAIDRKYLQELMEKRYMEGEPMSNEEIGEAARIDFQKSLQIQREIKDVLE
jgi:hypothetical protein